MLMILSSSQSPVKQATLPGVPTNFDLVGLQQRTFQTIIVLRILSSCCYDVIIRMSTTDLYENYRLLSTVCTYTGKQYI